MKHSFFILSLLPFYFLPTFVFAEAECGKFEFLGYLNSKQNQNALVVFKESQSETTILLPKEDFFKQMAFANDWIEGEVRLSKKIGTYKWEGQIQNLKRAVPDFLSYNSGQYLRRLKKGACR
jgi:hypothetical protein